ncbi:MAG: M48 family metalloprotease [Pyrinomonadaceae bacterium]
MFAPKPLKGDNIFKGEAENWLAEAILKLEVGSLRTISDKEVSNYVAQLGQHLVKYSAMPTKYYEFTVLDDSAENAFAIGGGRIFVNLGLLQNVVSEDELVSVIAHENRSRRIRTCSQSSH